MLSVVDPVDFTRVNSCRWWDARRLLLTTLRGDVLLLHPETEQKLLFQDGRAFGKGAVAACGGGTVLVLDAERKLWEGESGLQLVSRFALWALRFVSPEEKYKSCIEQREYSTALQLAQKYHFDTDWV